MTDQRAQSIIAICWVLSIVIGLTPMMGWHERSTSPNITCPAGLMRCLFEEVVVMEYMVYFNFFACVLIPLLLMLAIYLCIFMAARRQLKLMEVKAVHGENSRSTLQKEVQVAKSLAIIVGLFAVCWLPLHIINCFTLYCPQCERPPAWIMYVAIILSHANSVINPFIYAYRIREFRQTFRKIIWRHILGKQELLGSGSSTRGSSRFTTNSLSFDLFTEHSGSFRSYRCLTHMSPVEGGVVEVSRPPLSVIISHCPRIGPCPLRRTQIPRGQQQQQQQLDCAGPEVLEDKDKQNLGSGRVSSVLSRKSCFSELAKVL